jgi:trehalose/maltose transport system permease protein
MATQGVTGQKASSSKSASFSELAKIEERTAYWLLLPTFLVVLIIALYPLGSVFVSSFTNRTFASAQPTEFVGLQNYVRLLSMTIAELQPVTNPDTGEPVINPNTGEVQYQSAVRVLPARPVRYRPVTEFSLFGNRYVIGATDPDFIRSVIDTLVFTIATVLLELLLGMGIALVINSFSGRSVTRAILMAIMLIPWAIPTAVSSRIWEFMFQASRAGFFNMMAWRLGLSDGTTAYLSDPAFQMPAMIMIDVWKTTSFMALLLMAGLQLISGEIYEAASVDGSSRVRTFFSITLPLLKGTIAVALVFRTLDALRVFDVFQIVLAQSRYSMASFTYYQLINSRTMGYSSASSVLIFLLILIFSVIYIRSLGVESE